MFDELFLEVVEPHSTIIKTKLYPRVEAVLKTPAGDRKFKMLVGQFIDKNAYRLHTAGPLYQIVFINEKKDFYTLFDVHESEIKTMVDDILKGMGKSSSFIYLRNNPIFFLFYCVIRYYTLKKDTKGINTALLMYAVAVYPSVFSLLYPYPPNEGVMQYTIDHLSEKFTIKKAGSLEAALFVSITSSYSFLKQFINEATDGEAIRFIQRIHNDQKSMMKNITDEYMINYRAGNRVSSTLDSNANGEFIDDTQENNTSVVSEVGDKVVVPIMNAGVNLMLVTQAKDIAGISLSDCRYYLGKIIVDRNTAAIRAFIEAILFRFLYDEHHTKNEINSKFYIIWASQLFRQTNSNNPNVKIIKDTLDVWAEDVGIHAKFKREASRVNYKRAIFFYFVLAIQYYNR